jgi:hypothetical protein
VGGAFSMGISMPADGLTIMTQPASNGQGRLSASGYMNAVSAHVSHR